MSFHIISKMKESSSDLNDSKSKSTPIAMVAPELKQNADLKAEITKTCAVLGCDDFKNLEKESFFRFPEDTSLRQIWTDLTGRNNWTPTDYSYICIQHFSVDCFEAEGDTIVLNSKAVPSQKLPGHVFEVEYIDEESLYNEDEESNHVETEATDYEEDSLYQETSTTKKLNGKREEFMETEEAINMEEFLKTHETMETEESMKKEELVRKEELKKTEEIKNIDNNVNVRGRKTNVELLKLFSEVQRMQRQVVGLKAKLKSQIKKHNRQNKHLQRLKEMIEIKKKLLSQKKKKKARILLSIQDKIKEDKNGLLLAMPTKQTEDLKNFSLSIYKYSPQAYVYIRNMLRTMLPATDVLESWLSSGQHPTNVMLNNSSIKINAEQTDTELSCKITLG